MFDIPIVLIVLFVSSLIALLVFLTSTFEKPPPYHWVFAYFGFTVSMLWVYLNATYVVNLVNDLGYCFSLSDTILGLTILSWGNCIGGKRIFYVLYTFTFNYICKLNFHLDLVSNLSMARQGFPRMGLSACFGGSLLS